ncbi:MAG: DUF4832 domain-containing protein [Planctomycetia bacterium]
MRPLCFLGILVLLGPMPAGAALADELRPVRLISKIANVQPMTGVVLWNTNPEAADAPIQLEYCYVKYDEIVRDEGKYDWEPLEKLLRSIAERKHQAILRWHDTYVGQATGVPAYIKALPDYRETTAPSEKKQTGFPDWSNAEWRNFVLEFFTKFSEKYDRDSRIAFVQVGFGLWAEYHIYDGPMKLGKIFPSIEYQEKFAKHLAVKFRETPWMISVDAAGEHAPFADNKGLLGLNFGLFDDSFNHRRHKQENEPNWDAFGRDRWKKSPAGGEFSFFEAKDQKKALAPKGPYGVPFAEHAAKFHVSFIIGDDQPTYQKADVIRRAGLSCGYRFKVNRFDASRSASEVVVENVGIAPIYYDAFPAVNGVVAKDSLKGLSPGESKLFKVGAGGETPVLTIESNRLVDGQRIEYEADLN